LTSVIVRDVPPWAAVAAGPLDADHADSPAASTTSNTTPRRALTTLGP
jgi:hypothetical protein